MSQRSNGPARQRFPRGVRLRTRRDFLAVQERGRKFAGAHYMLFALERKEQVSGPSWDPATGSQTPPPCAPPVRRARLGFTVSRKVGGAVVRNRVRRWLRESCRRWQGVLGPRSDVVIIARPSAATMDYQTTLREVQGLLGRLERR